MCTYVWICVPMYGYMCISRMQKDVYEQWNANNNFFFQETLELELPMQPYFTF